MKTGFLFFVADHQIVGQLNTNPNGDKSLLSCLKVTQCSTSEIGDAPLYNSLSTDPSYDNRTIASTLKMQIWIATNNRDVPRVMKTKFSATVMVFGVVWSEGHIMPPHIFEVGLKVNTKVYLDVLKSVVIPWCNQVVGGRPWLWQQDSTPAHKSKQTQAWLQKECYDFVHFSHWPPSFPDLNPLDYFVWSYAENITNMTFRNTKAITWPSITPKPAWLSIRRALAGACGKGMLPVSDPYRGVDWGWRRLHWIDVGSTT